MNPTNTPTEPGTTFTVREIGAWILGEQIHDGNGNTPLRQENYNKLIRFLAEYISDPEGGIAATTQRNRRETGR